MSTKSRIILAVSLLTLTLGGCAAGVDSADPPAPISATPTPSTTPALTEGELLAWKQLAANNPGSLGPGEGEAEYAQARAEFPLAMPEGTAIPETTSFDFYTPGGVYERGMGYGLVSWTWLCATESTLIDAIEQGDDDRVDAAYAQLDLWITLPSKQRMFEGTDAFRSSVIDPARAGDTKPLETDRQSWCGMAPFETS